MYAILIFNYILYEVGYDEEGESKLEDEEGDEDCLLLWSSRFIILFILLTKSSSVIGFLIKYRVESDRAFSMQKVKMEIDIIWAYNDESENWSIKLFLILVITLIGTCWGRLMDPLSTILPDCIHHANRSRLSKE